MVPTLALQLGKTVKLGRIRPKSVTFGAKYIKTVLPNGKEVLTPRLTCYYDPAKDQAPPPAKVDYYTKASASLSRVYLNDQYGDCVIAGKYHQEGVWSANDTTQGQQPTVVGTDSEVLSAYHTICGPGDHGCVITEVLDYFQKTGLTFSGVTKTIDGYVGIDWTNKLMVQVALEVFGGLTIGINLPSAWTCTNCTWDVTNTQIVGGHDVCCVGYDDTGVQIATWGGIVTITWAAFLSKNWIEECYAELAPDWYGQDKVAVNGINLTQLRADLQALASGQIPDPGPTPTPAPTITSIVPNSGAIGSNFIINGTNLGNGAYASFGIVRLATVQASDTALTVTVPTTKLGVTDVTVTSADGKQWWTQTNAFTVTDGPPPPPPPPPLPVVLTGVVHIPAMPLASPFTFLKTQAQDVPVTVSSQPSMQAIPRAVIIAILRQGLAFVCANPGIFGPNLQPIIAQICQFIPPATKAPCGCK